MSIHVLSCKVGAEQRKVMLETIDVTFINYSNVSTYTFAFRSKTQSAEFFFLSKFIKSLGIIIFIGSAKITKYLSSSNF